VVRYNLEVEDGVQLVTLIDNCKNECGVGLVGH